MDAAATGSAPSQVRLPLASTPSTSGARQPATRCVKPANTPQTTTTAKFRGRQSVRPSAPSAQSSRLGTTAIQDAVLSRPAGQTRWSGHRILRPLKRRAGSEDRIPILGTAARIAQLGGISAPLHRGLLFPHCVIPKRAVHAGPAGRRSRGTLPELPILAANMRSTPSSEPGVPAGFVAARIAPMRMAEITS